MSGASEIGTVLVVRVNGEPRVQKADPHILVSAGFLSQYSGVDGDTMTLPDGYVYELGEWAEGRQQRHAYLVAGGA